MHWAHLGLGYVIITENKYCLSQIIFFCFVRYATRADYDRICEAISLKYPYLQDYDGSTVSINEAWLFNMLFIIDFIK